MLPTPGVEDMWETILTSMRRRLKIVVVEDRLASSFNRDVWGSSPMRSSHSGERYTLSQESLRLKDIGHEFGHLVVWELLNRPAYPDFGCLNDDYDEYDDEDSVLDPQKMEDGACAVEILLRKALGEPYEDLYLKEYNFKEYRRPNEAVLAEGLERGRSLMRDYFRRIDADPALMDIFSPEL